LYNILCRQNQLFFLGDEGHFGSLGDIGKFRITQVKSITKADCRLLGDENLFFI
jgi:hypothetical protein